MISQYSSSATSKEELEMMKELFESLEKARPSLFRLASDTEENDTDGINSILQCNDAVTRVMTLYKEKVEGEKPVGDYTAGAKDTSLLDDLGFDSSASKQTTPAPAASSSGLLENDFRSFGLGDMSELGSVFSNPATATSQQQQQMPGLQGLSAPASVGMPNFGAQAAFVGGMASMRPAAAGAMPFPTTMPPAYSAISHNVRPMAPAATPALTPSLSAQPTSATTNGMHPSSSQSQPVVSVFSQPNSSTNAAGNTNSSLSDLDILDKSLQDYKLSKDSFPVKTAPAKLPMNQLAANKAAAVAAASLPSTSSSAAQMPLVSTTTTATANSLLMPQAARSNSSTMPVTNTSPAESDFSPLVSAAPEPELLPLTDVFVPLEKIQPAPNIASIQAYEKNGLKVMVHFAADRPRPDVVTMVVSSMSTNPSPVSGFVFQAAVPKTMKVKLQPPSASEFPAFNPILPPAAITQVMLVANPRKEKVRLKFKLSYSINGEQFSDVGDIEGIPVQ
ncbi:ADP-ribosylation factor-binding protein gga3 [Plakobranchus ocellatus]|uniref:ADP-ribosylation factor-binding protein gga3 n=1 Tax=Plakobranchus ocellatus TaxID=259542 RepID=A0AAV4BWT2_9GAST|nr:ADP-ribosylation factor-binding protein gga3 [Plakobranchus ocellatus]